MKKILLAILAAGCCLWFTGCNQTESQDQSALEAARKDAASISNQLIEASMKLNHFEQMVKVLELEVTNLTQTAHQFSNKVVELRAHLGEQQKQLIAAQTEVPKRDLRIFELENKLNEQAAQIARLMAQVGEGETRVAPLEKHIAELEAERARLQADNERLKLERSELLRLWDDPAALQLRLKEVDPKQIQKSSSKTTKHSYLALMPDGGIKASVQSTPSTNAPSKAPRNPGKATQQK